MPNRQTLNNLKLELLSIESEILRQTQSLKIARAENMVLGQFTVIGILQIAGGLILIAGYLYFSYLYFSYSSSADLSFGFFNGIIAFIVLGMRAIRIKQALASRRKLHKIVRAVEALEKQRDQLEVQLNNFHY